MSFRGDLSTIGLAEVFQMISMAGKAGSLIVQDQDSRKCIYFGPEGVQLLSTGKRKGMKLGELLVRAGKLSEFRLREVLENQKITKKLLGEALIESGYVTEDDIHGVVRGQIEEEIYDLFMWPRANFEFVEGDPAPELRDAESHVTRLAFDVNGLLLEAVRRSDEWRIINSKIPGMDSVFTFTSESARREEDSTSTDGAKRVYARLDGQSTVLEVVEASGSTKFDACKYFVDLLERGRIRVLTVGEILDLAARKMSEGRREKASNLMQAAMTQAPDDPDVAIRFARFLENDGKGKEACAIYVKAGRVLQDAGRPDEAVQHFQKALSLDPEDEGCQRAILEVHLAGGDGDKAAKMAGDLIPKAFARQDYEGARKMAESIIAIQPRNLDCRMALARVFHATGKKKELEEEVQFIRKNLPLDSGDGERVLKELSQFVPREDRPRTRPPPIRRRWKKIIVTGVVLFVLVAAGGGGAFYEMTARKVYEECRTKSSLEKGKHRYAEARLELQKFQKSPYRHSVLLGTRFQDDLSDLAEDERIWKENEKNRVEIDLAKQVEKLETDFKRAKDEFDQGNLSTARAALTRVRLKAEDLKKDAIFKEASSLIDKIDSAMSRAVQLKEKSKELVEQGKFKEAAEAIDELLRLYPRSDPAKEAEYPLAIYTRPGGVTVTDSRRTWSRVTAFDDKYMKPGERGGMILIYLRQNEALRLNFERATYEPVKDVPIGNRVAGKLSQDLTGKLGKWDHPIGSNLESIPVASGAWGFWTSGKNLFAVRGENREVWSESVTNDIEGSPVLVDGLVWFATGSKAVQIFDPAKPRGQREQAPIPLADSPRGGMGVSEDGKTAAVGCADKRVYVIDTKLRSVQWYRKLPADAACAPLVHGGLIVVACTDRTIYAFRSADEAERPLSFDAEGNVTETPVVVGNTLVFATENGRLWGVTLDTLARVWEKSLPAGIASRPLYAFSTLFVTCRDGKLYALDPADRGSERWKVSAGGPILGSPVVAQGMILFGADDKVFYAVDPERAAIAWKYRTPGMIQSTPAVVGSTVIFGAQNKVLYAVELD